MRRITGLTYTIRSSHQKLTAFDALMYGLSLFFLCQIVSRISVLTLPVWFYLFLIGLGILYFSIHWIRMQDRYKILVFAHLGVLMYALIAHQQILKDVDTLLYATQVPIEIPYILFGLCALLVIWLFTFMFVFYVPFLVFLFLSILLALMTISGMSLPWYSLLGLFLLFMLLLSRKNPSKQNMLFVSLVACLSLGISWLFAPLIQKPLSQSTAQLEQKIRDIIEEQGSEGRVFSSGIVSHGNNYAKEAPVFTVEIDYEPSYPIYIKNFTGSRYQDSQWSFDEEREVMSKIQGYYDSYIAPYTIRNYRARTQKELAKETGISLQKLSLHLESDIDLKALTPYDTLTAHYEQDLANFQFYPNLNYANDVGSISWSSSLSTFHQFETDAVHQVYTTVDTSSLSSLYKLVQENPKEDLTSITAFIVRLLQDHTEYTRTPGYMSLQEDAVEAFLFTKKKGYCVHYASTAALLYRMYGVPSRYATGYVIYPQDFKKKEKQYQATVPENRSHAWIELYFQNYGWIPVDMTPDSHGQIHVSYPGLEQETLQKKIQEDISNFSTLQDRLLQGGPKGVLEKIFEMLLFSFLFVFLIYKLFLYRHHQNQKRKWNATKYLDALIQTFQAMPLLRDVRYDQDHFVQTICQNYPLFAQKPLKELQVLAQQVYYSKHPGDLLQIKKIYVYCIQTLERSLPFWKRWWYRYWKQIL